MSRLASYLLFFAVSLTILGAVHYYVWARLVRDAGLPPAAHGLLTALVVALYLSMPLTFYLIRTLPPERSKIFAYVGFSWMGLVFFLLVLLVAVDVGSLLHRLLGFLTDNRPPADPERRLTIARMAAGAVAVIAAMLGAEALRSGLNDLMVREVRVPLARLPKPLSGTTIVQITDLHVGPTLGREFVAEVVRRVNALEPDVVAITGDLVDGSVRQLRESVAPLAKLRAKYGVYFVTGNHEYYSGVEHWCKELERLGIRVLRNQRVSIGDVDHSFDLAGIDDFTASQFGRPPNLKGALAGRDDSRELVLLAHQPRAIHEAERLGVGLQLSGHTHGGQLWPWRYMVRLQQPVVSGLARIGRAFVYVSNGTGYWGPPMRLGAPAEITKVVLQSAV